MNTSFVQVKDWPALAKDCGYHVEAVAERLDISTRWFEIKFKKRFRKPPHELFVRWRTQEIRKRAKAGQSGKEMLDEVHLANCSSLTRRLARAGLSLRKLKRRSP